MARCDAFGSEQRIDTCDALFERLLALDHARQPPWGPLHAVAVGCFFLQHPAHPRAPGDIARCRSFVRLWLTDGDAALQAATRAATRAARGGVVDRTTVEEEANIAAAVAIVAASDDGGVTAVPRRDRYTIEDVSIDGTFPAEGYRERLRRWARQALAPALPTASSR